MNPGCARPIRSWLAAHWRRGAPVRAHLAAGAGLLLSGCLAWDRPTSPPLSEAAYYQDVVQQVAFAVPDDPNLYPSIATGGPPRKLEDPRPAEYWQLNLHDAVRLALANVAVLRQDSQYLARGNSLMNAPDAVPSAFDPAIQDSGVLFGQRGTDSALSDFSPQFSTNMLWGRDELVQNNLFQSGGLPPGSVLNDENASFAASLDQALPTGGQFAVRHDWDYSGNNVPGRLFSSAYTGYIGAEFRQPLLAGAGEDYTFTAGPIGQRVRGVNGVSQGIWIARLHASMSLAEFETSILNLVKDTTDAYWDLSLAYREYETEKVIRDLDEKTWDTVRIRLETGLEGAIAADEAQAADAYFTSRARTESALAVVYQTEGRLRRLLGLVVSDTRLIHPAQAPQTGDFEPNWDLFLAEALGRRVELRRQKTNIESLSLQVRAARNLVQPRLDFVSGYRVNGFGDRLMGNGDDDGVTGQGYHDAYETIFQGNQTSWDLGFEFSLPLGLLNERTQVRNVELKLAKARAVLAAQELEISHELANAFQSLEEASQTSRTNTERRKAARRRVKAVTADYEANRSSLDLLLRARASLAQAEVAYQRSLVDYTKAIHEIHYRKGTLLEQQEIRLTEQPHAPPPLVTPGAAPSDSPGPAIGPELPFDPPLSSS